MSSDGPLDRLLESLSDGTPVDWADAEAEAVGANARARVGALRQVARIVDFSRDLQRAPLEPIGAVGAGPARWGTLTLLERIGAGASGAVWRAWDATLEREVALKFLDTPDLAGGHAALLSEARALARVRHRGVVAVHGIATHEERTGLWLELLRGRTLADTLERCGALPATEVARLGLELARALTAVDAAGLVHRDVKPANVVLEPDGRVVLTDFGLGARRDLAARAGARASGTPVFMAPELLSGGAASHRTDLYALGVTLWWALAGHSPFAARSLEELRSEAAVGPSVALATAAPEAPRALCAAIERAMAPDPARRFGGAQDMSEALEAAGRSAMRRDPAAARIDRAVARSSRLRTGLVGAAVLIAVAVGAAWLAPRLFPGPAAIRPTPVDATSPREAPGARPKETAGEGSTASFSVEATFLRHAAAGTERLAAGDRVRPGERLSLEFRAGRRMWVYVLNEDERGETYLLYPQPLFDRANPLPADSSIVLPGSIGGRENAWTVTSRGGREHFLIVAGVEPLAEIEAELAALPAASPDRPVRYARVGTATLERLRGVGGVAPVPATPTPRRAGLFQRFAALAGREVVREAIWVRRVTLANP